MLLNNKETVLIWWVLQTEYYAFFYVHSSKYECIIKKNHEYLYPSQKL